VSAKHTVRNGIIVATAGTVLGALLLGPVRDFLRGAWRLVTVIAGAAWDGLTATVPVWTLLAVAVVVAFVVRRTGRWSVSPDLPLPLLEPPTAEADEPDAPPVLSELEEAIVRLLAKADGVSLGMGYLSNALRTTVLRVEQALDRLERVGLVEGHRNYMHGMQYGLTRRGRDLVIARGDN